MSSSKRRQKDHKIAIASDYVERLVAPRSMKKKSSVSKAYTQAYQWYQDELLQTSQSSKQKKPITPVRRTAIGDPVSFMTEPIRPVIPHESLSGSESVSSTPTRYNKAPGLSPREPAPLPSISSRPSNTRYSLHGAERKDSSFIAPSVLQREKLSTVDVRLDDHCKGVSARPRSWNVVAIIGATTLIAICEHAAHILLQMTGLLSDLSLQFTAFFVKATCQALIIVFLFSKLHDKESCSTKERRRSAFYNFMYGHGDKMIAVDKLRAWFGDDAVFDTKILTKWVADDEREYWQYRMD